MRRLLAFILLLALLLQTSGSASASVSTPSADMPSFPRAVAAAILAAKRSFGETAIGAMLGGNASRYAAMHAPAPVFERREHRVPSVSEMRSVRRFVPRTLGLGRPGVPPQMLDRPLGAQESLRRFSTTAPHRAASSGTPLAGGKVARKLATTRSAQSVITNSPNVTGVNRYWSYEAFGIPGVGKAMVNVANGNLLVQSDDVDVHERGVDLAFRRTYNAMSGRDWAASGDDAGAANPGQFGNGWTNTFDAHLAQNDQGGISVFDIDGARYDYATNGTGCLTPPAGQHATLCSDGGIGYYWTKKAGTIYYFWEPGLGALQPSNAAYAGRTYMIYSRNHDNWLRFDYSWQNGDASSSFNLNQINVVHSDGQQLVLAFGVVNSTAKLLQSVTRPDGVQVTYTYDAGNNLNCVTEPSNGSANGTHCYGWYPGHQVYWVAGPRWTTGSWGQDGGYRDFSYNASRLATTQLVGFANITPDDGMSPHTPIQPTVRTDQWAFETTNFTYNSGSTSVNDADGHASIYTYDAVGRLTQRQAWSGTQYLVASETWDTQDNLIATADPRGNETDYGYDARGNTLWVQAPPVPTNLGTIRPVSRYAYDGSDNLIAYCDPAYVARTGITTCAFGSGATSYTYYTADGAEPFGKLTDAYSPLGYHTHFTYDNNGGSSDTGLPLVASGDCMSQNDGTSRCPSESFGYDPLGNIVSSNNGSGTSSMTYDGINRLLTDRDPDGIVAYRCYNADNSVLYSENAAQHALDGNLSQCATTPPRYALAVSYDEDGNTTSETAYVGGTFVAGGSPTLPTAASVTKKYYDAADRLVEVQEPFDSTRGEMYTQPWITRYFYDLSSTSGVASFGGSTIAAHGNLYKTQELLPSADRTTTQAKPISNATFKDMKGTAFDPLDRPTTNYFFVAGPTSDTLESSVNTYDATTDSVGALSRGCNALQQCATFAYDARGAVVSTAFPTSPSEGHTVTYDPDGRAVSVSSAFGAQQYSYDDDGREVQSIEPSSGGVTSPATLTYHYYADGKRSSLDVTSSGLTQANLLGYSYRVDGRLQQQAINLASNAKVLATSMTFSYSPGGRFEGRSESGPGANAAPIVASFDAVTGRASSVQYPGGVSNGFEYDPSGRLLGQQATPNGSTMSAQSFIYSARGELLSDTGNTQSAVSMANGVGVGSRGAFSTKAYDAWDGRMGVKTGSVLGGSYGTATGDGFDGAGRLTSSGSNTTTTDPSNDSWSSKTYTYDEENHVVSATWSNSTLPPSPSAAYDWGPNGHPIRIGTTPQSGPATYDTLHWDGDQLLFTSNGAGQVDDIKVGTAADVTPLDPGYSGITFWDRDTSGTMIYCHNATGSGGLGIASTNERYSIHGKPIAYNRCGLSMQYPWKMIWNSEAPIAPNYVGSGGILGMLRSDGLNDGFNTIQGVRSYDAQLGGWTTPDSYAGQVHDPMSQKSYVWNGNNPISYSDPSGFLYGSSANYDSLGGLDGPHLVVPDTGQIAKANGASPPMDQMEGAVAGAYEDDRAALGEVNRQKGYPSRSAMTRPGTQTAKQLEESTALTLEGLGASVKIDNHGVVALHAEFSTGQVGTIIFGAAQVAISITDSHGAFQPEATILMRWKLDVPHSDAWNNGYPAWRSITSGPNDWLPFNMQDDIFPKGEPDA